FPAIFAITLLAIGDIPTTALKVDGRSSYTAHNLFAATTGAFGHTAIRKRTNLFKLIATRLTNKFIDRHGYNLLKTDNKSTTHTISIKHFLRLSTNTFTQLIHSLFAHNTVEKWLNKGSYPQLIRVSWWINLGNFYTLACSCPNTALYC